MKKKDAVRKQIDLHLAARSGLEKENERLHLEKLCDDDRIRKAEAMVHTLVEALLAYDAWEKAGYHDSRLRPALVLKEEALGKWRRWKAEKGGSTGPLEEPPASEGG